MKAQQLIRSNKYLLIAAGIIACIVSYVIIYALNNRIEAYIREFNSKVPTQLAYVMANEVEEWIVPKTSNFDLGKFNQYNRNNPRLALKRFIQRNPDIKTIMLISPDNRIVICTDVQLEDLVYTKEDELEVLNQQMPQLVQRGANENINEFDVIWPVNIDGQFLGHIRMVIDINQLHDLDVARKWIVWGAIFAVSAFIILALWFAWRANVPAGAPVWVSGEAAPQSENGLQQIPQTTPGDQSVFSKLDEEYRISDDLDRSFQQSEQKAHSMMRVLNQGLLILDNNMHILSSNEYVLDVFHIRTKSNSQRKVYEILQKNPRMLEIYRRAKDPLTLEVKQNLPLNLLNGRAVNVEVLARPFMDDREQVRGVTFYLKNIDMLHELEQTLQRSMKYGVISQLSSSIGHEIRNPLSSLAIHTEIVDNMVERSIVDEQRLGKIKKSINILNSEVERLNKLIDQFFNLARAQEIQLTFENINDLMSEVIDLVSQQALEKNVEIHRQLGSELPMVKVSKDQLKQVIINIILNAFDAMKGGGELTLRTYFRDRFVVVAIRDNGAGIPENIRDHIFDLYFTTKETGGGIGLAISKKLIEAHEGNLYFETKTGVGTVFYIELPTMHN